MTPCFCVLLEESLSPNAPPVLTCIRIQLHWQSAMVSTFAEVVRGRQTTKNSSGNKEVQEVDSGTAMMERRANRGGQTRADVLG